MKQMLSKFHVHTQRSAQKEIEPEEVEKEGDFS